VEINNRTDDFIGYKYKANDVVTLIWKMRTDQEIIFEELKSYTKSHVKVNLNYITDNKIVIASLETITNVKEIN